MIILTIKTALRKDKIKYGVQIHTLLLRLSVSPSSERELFHNATL